MKQLKALMEHNNSLSPEILSAVIAVNDRIDAVVAAELYFGITGKEFPFKSYDAWARSLKLPAELYFVFDRKKEQGRFVRSMSKELPKVEVIT